VSESGGSEHSAGMGTDRVQKTRKQKKNIFGPPSVGRDGAVKIADWVGGNDKKK